MARDQNQSSLPGIHSKAEGKGKEEKLNRYVLVVFLIVATIAFLFIVKMFLIPAILASTFVVLLYPLYTWLLKASGKRKVLSSLICCALVLLGLLIPTYFLVHIVAVQAIELYNTAESLIREIIRKGDDGILGEIKASRLGQWLQIDQIDWQSSLQNIAKAAGSIVTTVINKTSAGVFDLITGLFIMLFTMFYFFIDGDRLLQRIKYLSPLRYEYEEMIFSRFIMISRATVKGTLLIGLTQGTIGAVTLLIFGVSTWMLWGFVMVVLSLIPMVGAWIVLIPAAIIQIVLGNLWQGIGIILITTVVISNIDNLMRPRLVGRQANMHDLIIFFSTLGGISVFGIWGFIVGPVVAALFLAILDIYSLEFQKQLSLPQNVGIDK